MSIRVMGGNGTNWNFLFFCFLDRAKDQMAGIGTWTIDIKGKSVYIKVEGRGFGGSDSGGWKCEKAAVTSQGTAFSKEARL